MHRHLLTFILGGNRTGKSEGGAQLAVAYALGRHDPATRAWLQNNRLPQRLIPVKPSTVIAVALTHKDSKAYVRPKIQRYAPRDTYYRKWLAEDQAEAIFPGGGKIVCKCVRQGRRAFQGTAVHLVWFDEEPDDYQVVLEAMRGLIDYGGRMIFTMTCLDGWTELLKRHVRRPSNDTAVHYLDSFDNPWVANENIKRILAHFDEATAETRRTGAIRVLEGRVYTAFSRARHVVEPFEIPGDWTRIRVWDFGTRNPTCVLWVALDPADDTMVVYREHYKAEWTLRQHAEHVRHLTGNEEIETTVADPADAGAILALESEHEIPVTGAKKSVLTGIGRVQERLRLDAEGKPHLLVFNTCVNTVDEFEGYKWAPSKEAPVKKDDHAMDCVRYGAMYLASGSDFGWT